MRYLIGIDLGTSAVKSVLFDENGQEIVSHSVGYPMNQPKNGWAEQNPKDWWEATVQSIQYIIAHGGINTEYITGLGIAGQMHGLVMLDEQNEVIRPAIIWCDQRTVKECAQITKIVGRQRLIDLTANPAMTGFTAAKILWVRNNEPEQYRKCRHILLPKDYIRYKLTGEFVTDVSDASGTQLLDIANRCWSDEVIERLGLDKRLLPRVCESPEVTGTIAPCAAKLTGLSVKTAVVGGAGDNAAAAVGVGVIEDKQAFTTIGSSGVVFAHTSKMCMDRQGRVHTFCCAVPGQWHVMGVTQAAGLSLKWFSENFCGQEKEQAEKTGEDIYSLTDQKASESPIGCNKLIYLPYLMGERTPHLDPACRGVFFGLSAMHKKKDMIRAVMEGVSYSLKECLEILKETGAGISDMTVCGGGAKSALWREMLADIYGCPIKTCRSKEGPALGAAILAAVGTGIYPSVREACSQMIHCASVTQPDIPRHDQYMKFYQIYLSLYPALHDIYQNLANEEEAK